MPIDARYREQVQLLVQILPLVAAEGVFALKGGTAINLFVRDMPRLSVDIDLAFLPTGEREKDLANCKAALARIATNIRERLGVSAELQSNRADELRVIVRSAKSQVKIEVSPVLRGILHPAEILDVAEAVEDAFGFASVPVVSLPDLYGGKICAALDRQHPRDWFDVMQMLDAGDFTRDVFLGFLVYLLGHPRPLSEVLAPRWKPLEGQYQQEFVGMLREDLPLESLEQTRQRLIAELAVHMNAQDVEFLLSFKAGQPNWELLPLVGVADLPAVRWKLKNIARMPVKKHIEAVERLRSVLNNLLTKGTP